jgi:hypothetical protein
MCIFNKEIVDIFLKYRANANIQNNEGEIPIKVLFYTTPSCELFKLLINHKAHPYITE